MDDKEILKLEDKKFVANKANRAENTKQILNKLDEIKPEPFPEKIKMELVNEPNDLAKAFFSMLKGEKGEQGEQGIQGEKGEKGEDSQVPGPKGDRGEQGKPGKNGKDGQDGVDGKDGENGKDGRDGKDGSPDTGLEIAKKLTELKDEDRLDISSLKGLTNYAQDIGNNFLSQAKGFVSKTLAGQADVNIPNPTNGQILTYNKASGKWIASNAGSGSGTVQSVVAGTGISVDSTDPANPIVSATGGGFTELAATGTIDGSNASFTFTQEPTYIVSDHAWYKSTNKSGTTNWTWNGVDTATMTVAPTEDIFGVA